MFYLSVELAPTESLVMVCGSGQMTAVGSGNLIGGVITPLLWDFNQLQTVSIVIASVCFLTIIFSLILWFSKNRRLINNNSSQNNHKIQPKHSYYTFQ